MERSCALDWALARTRRSSSTSRRALSRTCPARSRAWRPARDAGLPVTDWLDSHAPRFKGVKIDIEDFETAHSLAIRPDRSGFCFGNVILCPRLWTQPASRYGKRRMEAEATGVDFSADGQVLVVACDDGTVRWRRWSDGAELLALFVDAKRRWVAWTPTGYYMASPGGEDLIGWQLNRGWAQQADFFPASRCPRPVQPARYRATRAEDARQGAAVKQADEAASASERPRRSTRSCRR